MKNKILLLFFWWKTRKLAVWHKACSTILLFILVMFSLTASANTYNVNTTADGHSAVVSPASGTTNLRGAIEAADGLGGTHTINVPAGTYSLNLGEITFGNKAENITITGTAGAASTIISMSTTSQDRIFFINPPGTNAGVSTTISGITFTNGHLKTDNYGGGAIVGGGPTNILKVTNCVFTNNTLDASLAASNYGGGAIAFTYGGNLTLDNCTFTGNSTPSTTAAKAGGAVYYYVYGSGSLYPSAALSITNCTFNNNSVNTNGNGGALYVFVDVNGTSSTPTLSESITNNNFTNNSAPGTTGLGGAIYALSGNTTTTININYNRFYNNSAGSNGSGLYMQNTNSGVNASNNWWGCNDGPSSCADKAYTDGSSSKYITTPYLQLKTMAQLSSVCSGTTDAITSGFTSNSAGNTIDTNNLKAFNTLSIGFTATSGTVSPTSNTITSGVTTTTYTAGAAGSTGTVNATVDNVPTSDATARASIANNGTIISAQPNATVTGCAGNTVTFTANGTGTPTPTFQWTKGGTNVTNGATGNGSTISGATGTVLTITNAQVADNGTYNFVSTNTCNNAKSNNSVLTISSATMASSAGSISGSNSISSTNTAINSSACIAIANVVPSGGNPVSGTVTATATYDATVLRAPGKNPYVQRHYDIVPANNAANATATITLYYLQKDFDNYDTSTNHGLDLPKSTTDPEGNKANIRVVQYHGTGTAPGNYTGSGVILVPTNVVYNITMARWEVTVTVTGFSGFYLSNPNTVLPITLLSFTGTAQNGSALLQWSTSNEVNTSHFEILRSVNGIDFVPIGQLPTTGNGSNGTNSYQYKDAMGGSPVYYYQLKMVDIDGRFTASSIVAINNILVNGNSYLVQVTPNPFLSKILLSINAPSESQLVIELVDLSGKKLFTQTKSISLGNNTISIDQLNNIANGTYLLHLFNGNINQTIKLIKTK